MEADYLKNSKYLLADLIILSEIVTSILIIAEFHSFNYDSYDDTFKLFLSKLIDLLKLLLEATFTDSKNKLQTWNEKIKNDILPFIKTDNGLMRIVEFINNIEEKLKKDEITDILKFISLQIDEKFSNLKKKKKSKYFLGIIGKYEKEFDNKIDLINDSIEMLLSYKKNSKEKKKELNFMKLEKELSEALKQLTKEKEEKEKIKEDFEKCHQEKYNLFEKIELLNKQNQEHRKIMDKFQMEFLEFKNKSEEDNIKINELNKTVKIQNEKLSELNKTVKIQNEKISELNKTVKIQNEKISELNKTVKIQNETEKIQNEKINELNKTVKIQNETEKIQNEKINELNKKVKIQKQIVENLQNQIIKSEDEKKILIEKNKNLMKEFDQIFDIDFFKK